MPPKNANSHGSATPHTAGLPADASARQPLEPEAHGSTLKELRKQSSVAADACTALRFAHTGRTNPSGEECFLFWAPLRRGLSDPRYFAGFPALEARADILRIHAVFGPAVRRLAELVAASGPTHTIDVAAEDMGTRYVMYEFFMLSVAREDSLLAPPLYNWAAGWILWSTDFARLRNMSVVPRATDPLPALAALLVRNPSPFPWVKDEADFLALVSGRPPPPPTLPPPAPVAFAPPAVPAGAPAGKNMAMAPTAAATKRGFVWCPYHNKMGTHSAQECSKNPLNSGLAPPPQQQHPQQHQQNQQQQKIPKTEGAQNPVPPRDRARALCAEKGIPFPAGADDAWVASLLAAFGP
jgi:hypothetical protein